MTAATEARSGPPQVVRRSALERGLREAQESTLSGLETVRGMLRRAIHAALSGDRAAADALATQSAELEGRYEDIHGSVLALVACQAPVAGDLRLAMALVHVNDRIARMGAQCLNVATLRGAMADGARPSQSQRECLSQMGELLDEQVGSAGQVFAERDVEGMRKLRDHDKDINRHNRRCFEIAVEEGAKQPGREAALFVAMMARALERIGDNAVDIGQQAAFVATGRLHGTPIA